MIYKLIKKHVNILQNCIKIATDTIVDRDLTRLIEISIKNYVYPEISSSMENQLREYFSFGGVI